MRALLESVGEEITDDQGQVIGYVHAPARFKLGKEYLGNGGFLQVERDELTGEFVASEWDALWDKQKKRFYPAGYCDPDIWRTPDLEAAVQLVLAALQADG